MTSIQISDEELDIMLVALAEQGEYWTRESLKWALTELSKENHPTTPPDYRSLAISAATWEKLGYRPRIKQLFSVIIDGVLEILNGHEWGFESLSCTRCGLTLFELHSSPFRMRELRGRSCQE